MIISSSADKLDNQVIISTMLGLKEAERNEWEDDNGLLLSVRKFSIMITAN